MKRRRILRLALVATCLAVALSVGLVTLESPSRERPAPRRQSAATPPRRRAPTPPLHVAAREGDLERVRALIAEGADVNAKDPMHGETPLHKTVYNEYKEIALLLIEHGADVDGTGTDESPLHDAAFFDRIEMVRLLLDNGADINVKNADDETPLHRASEKGHYGVAALLAARGADLSIKRSDGYTPMHLALRHRHRKTAEMLLDRGANANVRGARDETPLHDAARLGDPNLAARLIEAGLDVNAQSNRSETPLLAAMTVRPRGLRVQRDVIEFLVTYGADVNATNKFGDTPLLIAAAQGEPALVELMIAHDGNIDVRNNNGQTPLIGAVAGGHLKVLELLVAKGASIDVKTDQAARTARAPTTEGRDALLGKITAMAAEISARTEADQTPLITATSQGNKTMVAWLLAHGTDVDARGGSRKGTALHYAAECGFTPIVRLLLDGGAEVNVTDGYDQTPIALAVNADRRRSIELLAEHGAELTVHVAAYLGNGEALEELLENGADLNTADEAGHTPLHVAVEQRQREVIAVLLAHHAKVDAGDRYGRTPLFLAATEGAPDLARILANAGANVNVGDLVGRTALHMAAEQGYLEIVRFLVGRGANLDAQTTRGVYDSSVRVPGYFAHSGWTPLQAAAGKDREEVMRLLIAAGAEASIWQAVHAGDLETVKSMVAAGADVNTHNRRLDETLLHLAARSGHVDITEFLLVQGADPGRGNRRSQRALHLAARAGHREVAELLLKHGATVDAMDYDGCAPLHEACIYDHQDVAACLLDRGAVVNKTTSPLKGVHWPHRTARWTPLHCAAALGNREIAELLLARGADVNAEDKDDSTPLHEAAYYGHTAVVELLMAHGADPNGRNAPVTRPDSTAEPSKTPLDHARAFGFADTVAALGGDPNDPGLTETGPYTVIITEAQGLRRFLWFQGMDFADVWIPTSTDIEGLNDVLRTFLRENAAIKARIYFHREYVLAHLRQYSREYSGFVKDGTRRIICQMHLRDGNMVLRRRAHQFTQISDGGCAVVKVVFDAETKTVLEITCNGEA